MSTKRAQKLRKITHKRKRRAERQSPVRQFLKRAEHLFGGASVQLDARRHQEKMSEVILDFAKPMLDAVDEENYPAAIQTAILGWNLALLPANARQDLLSRADPEFAETAGPVVEFLAHRKRALYPDIRRHVLDFDLTWNSGAPRLLIVSSDTNLDGQAVDAVKQQGFAFDDELADASESAA